MVKKSFKKIAFTIPEILMTLCIIGIILVSMIKIVKVNDNVLSLQYVNAYNTLATAAYNTYIKATKDQNNDSKMMYEGKALCNGIAYYLNNTTASSSDANICDNITLLSYNRSNHINEQDEVHFSAQNGMRFYFTNSLELEQNKKEKNQRIVWIDVNGPKGPNTTQWAKNKPADIVPFGINSYGEVYPMGCPKFDTRYMRANIIYDVRTEMTEGLSKYSYYEAQKKAFGDESYDSDVMSYNYDQKREDLKTLYYFEDSTNITIDTNCRPDNGTTFAKCSVEIAR